MNQIMLYGSFESSLGDGSHASVSAGSATLDAHFNENEASETEFPDIADVLQANVPTVSTKVVTRLKGHRREGVLNYKSHMYYKDRDSKDGNKTYWYCVNKKDHNCRGRIHTAFGTDDVCFEIAHSCEPNAVEKGKKVFKAAMYKRAVDTIEKPSQLLDAVLQQTSQAVSAEIQKSATRRFVQRSRKQLRGQAFNPANLDFVLPQRLHFYSPALNVQERFLLADNIDNGKRILVFGRESHGTWMNHVTTAFLDGTFKITPRPFTQTYVISVERDGFVFPVLYALLPDKSFETYQRLFQMIKQEWETFEPTNISLDFEMATINAVRIAFPNADVWGCLFHLVQNMKKQLYRNGLKGAYEDIPDKAVAARMITSLAFVKPEDVRRYCDALWEYIAATHPDLAPVMNWFESNYIGRTDQRGAHVVQIAPLFPVDLWNVYQRTLDGNHRTNNFAEAGNRRINTEFASENPDLATFIDRLAHVQRGRDQLYETFVQGNAAKRKRNKYQVADAKILKIVQGYDNQQRGRTPVEYLRGIAHHFVM